MFFWGVLQAMINRGTEKDQMEVMIAISVLRAARANMEKAAQADDECSTPDEDTFTDAGSRCLPPFQS